MAARRYTMADRRALRQWAVSKDVTARESMKAVLAEVRREYGVTRDVAGRMVGHFLTSSLAREEMWQMFGAVLDVDARAEMEVRSDG